MINIKFHNLPTVFTKSGPLSFDYNHRVSLFEDLGTILGCSPTVPQLFILGDTKDYKIVYDGEKTISTAIPVRVTVEWAGESLIASTKAKVARALCSFLEVYNLQKDALIVFQQISVDDAYVEKGGGIVPVPQLIQRPHDFLGFTKR